MFVILIVLVCALTPADVTSLSITSHQASVKDPQPPDPPIPADVPYFTSAAIKSLHLGFIKKCFQVLLEEGLFFNSDTETAKSPFQFQDPEILKTLMNFEVGEIGSDHDKLIQFIRQVIQYTPHASHPYMVHKRMAGLDPYALMGDWLASVLHAPVVLYITTPVFIIMEFEVMKKMRELVGYTDDTGGGVVAPGGGWANIYAVQLALQRSFPSIKEKGFAGIGNPNAVMFVSQDASPSFTKGAILQGIGSDSCVKIKTDKFGRMDVNDLVYQIKLALRYGRIPFMVVATAGTPTLGAIDPIEKIAEIAEYYNLWLHVDGQHSGSVLFSVKQRKRFAGVEKSDSFSWCPTSILGMPFVGSILVTKTKKIIIKSFSTHSEVVFAKHSLYNQSYDIGDGSIQTSRRPDILKIWLAWKAKGKNQLEAHVNYVYDNVKYCTAELKSRKGKFQVVLEKFESHLVSFYFVPTQLRRLQRTQMEILIKFGQFNEKLKINMLKDGKMQISESELSNYPNGNCLTMNLANSALTKEDIKYLLDIIEIYGLRLEKEFDWVSIAYFITTNPGIKEKYKMDLNGITFSTHKHQNGKYLKLDPLPVPPKRKESHPTFVSAPIQEIHGNLFKQFLGIILDEGIFFEDKKKEPPLVFKKPEELSKIFDFSLTDNGLSDSDFLKTIREIIKYSSHVGHPYYIYQLLGGLDPYSLMADMTLAAMTSPMTTYEDGPVYALMEEEIERATRRRINYSADGIGDGMILPGGSLSNLVAIRAAVYKKFPLSKQYGISIIDKPLVLYVSENSHYSFLRGSFLTGIGMDNCVLVESDELGKMSIPALKRAIEKSKSKLRIPFMVGATAGTTVLGAIDPLEEIGEICRSNGMWFHVDAAFGGSVMMTKNDKLRGLLNGVNESDSFTFNAHKLLAATGTATILVSRHKDIFKNAFGTENLKSHARLVRLYDHKYDTTENYMSEDRRANIFKIWFMWKAKGLDGLGKHLEYVKENTRYVSEQMATVRNATFELSLPNPELTNVCFHYIPPSLKNLDKNSSDYHRRLSEISRNIQAEVLYSGIMVLAVQQIRDLPLFLKFVLMNSALTKADCDFMMDAIEFHGRNL